jgi:predicted short-subunit dehydrogenase-like oxidoreductase (DUF2520 family)
MTPKSSISVAIVGLGAVGRVLARALAETGVARLTLVGSGGPAERRWAAAVIPQRKAEAQQAGRYGTRLEDIPDDIDIIVITVEDRNLASVAGELAALPLPWKRVAVLHTSGSQGSAVLAPVAAQGAGVAAWHPFQTFPARAQNVPLTGITFGISGEGRGSRAARRLTRILGGRPLAVPEAERVLYHLSAVLACGFVAADLQAAVGVLKTLGVSEQRALEAVLPIAASTLSNIRELGIEAAQTGPAVRGDLQTIRKHRQALGATDKDLARLYAAVTEYVMKARSKRG